MVPVWAGHGAVWAAAIMRVSRHLGFDDTQTSTSPSAIYGQLLPEGTCEYLHAYFTDILTVAEAVCEPNEAQDTIQPVQVRQCH